MSFGDKDSRTEKPTPKRREKARSEGSVAKSAELNSAVVLVTASFMLIWFGAQLTRGLGQIMINIFTDMGKVEITTDSMPVYMWAGMKNIVLLLAPIFAGLMVAGIAVNVGQIGFKVTPKAAYPKFSRVNPINGFKRLFTVRSLVELAKSIIKMLLVGGVVYVTITSQFSRVYSLVRVPVEALGATIGDIVGHVFLMASLSLIVLGALDYLYNRYDFEKSLKMTKEEVKEEAKQADGDPKVKGKIRELMFKSSFRRMMKKLPEADVVITNPTHYAVALKYDRHRSSAPIVIAKGARLVALRIREVAKEHGIPIVENPPLARALYAAADIGQEIPVELYKAVAEVLAYVYRLKHKFFGVA
jgi:flagellar biosynthesis protein FlhB